MVRLFRRAPEEDLEDEVEIDAGEEVRLLPEVPQFAVIVSTVATNGWHMAAVVGDSSNPDFYARALAVRWPFVIARPAPSNRISDRPVSREQLSPTGTTPARRVVVNWRWETAEGDVSQLRFYVKRAAPWWFLATGRAKVRVTLKELAWPRRRIVAKLRSNSIIWNPPDPETPASPPEQST